MGEQEVTQFLNSLAMDRNVAASTQNQALRSILFLYKEVLKQQSIPTAFSRFHSYCRVVELFRIFPEKQTQQFHLIKSTIQITRRMTFDLYFQVDQTIIGLVAPICKAS